MQGRARGRKGERKKYLITIYIYKYINSVYMLLLVHSCIYMFAYLLDYTALCICG